VIDISNYWHDGEKIQVLGKENIVHDYQSTVYCYYYPFTNERREMAYGWFEKERETLKYRCPARHYELECQGTKHSVLQPAVCIFPLLKYRRIFTPFVRSSYKWKATYKKRTAVERINARLDESFEFEKHFFRHHMDK